MNYYDFVLAFVPLTLFGLTGVLTVGGLGLTTAVPIAAAAAAGLIGHAMFVNAPVASAAERPVDAVADSPAGDEPLLG